MGKMEKYLEMSTDETDLIQSDLTQMKDAFKNLYNHSVNLAVVGGVGFGTAFLRSIASFAAIYLLILDRTNWRTNMLTGLLIPYIFLSLPEIIFSFLRGEVGMWIAFIAVVMRLFFSKRIPEWAEMPGALILLLVVSPSLFADTIRGNFIGQLVCLFVGCYLLQEHIRASGGFRNSFTQKNGVSNSVGIILLLVYPVWALVLGFI
ncbi:hypothetical protein ZOSMA_6G01720 [Zostera marina]|uniref:Cold-regulated 413 plasma membrane protein 2 n=1 Tax=Zostera marina TaxID=29655 RepID=A0A0K9NRL3_ZOSMR|nr:hypothetical protein ZOSMA_6G01720 [Zostera marina]